jgi:hypothetical protein
MLVIIYNRYWGCFEGIKLPECESDYSLPSSAKVKNDGNISPLSNMPSWCGV